MEIVSYERLNKRRFRQIPYRKIFNVIVVVLLVIAIPCIALFSASNVALRIPDVYKYELNRTEIADEIGLEMTADETADFISSYMFGDIEKFQIEAEYQGKDRALFTEDETKLFGWLRDSLDKSLIILIVCVLYAAFAYWLLFRQKMKKSIRNSYLAGMGLFVLTSAASAVILLSDGIRPGAVKSLTGYVSHKDDILLQLFNDTLTLEFVIVIFAMSALLLLIGMSVTWRFTKPERIFSNGIFTPGRGF